MIRIVLDTNIIVSALLRSGGLPDAALRLGLKSIVQMCVSDQVLREYEEVLRRPKLRIPLQKTTTALEQIRTASLVVKPTCLVKACSDPDDDIFLECAQEADANYLVTGNITDFPKSWANTRVVTTRQFLEIMIDIQFGK